MTQGYPVNETPENHEKNTAECNGFALTEQDRARANEMSRFIEDRVAVLRDVKPYMIDMSSREATLSSYFGHTLDDKKELHRLACDLGFDNFGLPNFFAFPSVVDEFLDDLVADGESLDPFFTTIAVEPLKDGAPFPMGPAAKKTVEFGIPNVILLVETCPSVVEAIGSSREKMIGDLRDHILEYRRLLPPPGDRKGRIFVRLGDPFDTFDQDVEYLTRIFKMLGTMNISGVLFEDVKGTRFPFETYALVTLMRHYLPRPHKILAHSHLGNGTEDAASLECILAGGDGVWSGFTPQAAQGGHGSALMLLTNLLRARNPHVRRLFNTEKFQEVAERMWHIHDHTGIPPNTAVVGERAYLYVDKYFEQTDNPRDLDPDLIGRTPGYQVMPSWAPTYVIGKRLTELGYGNNIARNATVLNGIRAKMNAMLMEGRQMRFDDPANMKMLVDLVLEDLGGLDPVMGGMADDESAALTQRYR